MFAQTSRYAGLATRTITAPDGRLITYVARRIVPPAAAYVAAGGVTTSDSDRLDNIAHRYLGDPLGLYQVADANEAMHPMELTAEPGRRLVIPLPRHPGTTS